MTTVTKKCLAHLPVIQSLCLDPVENPTFQGFHLRHRYPVLSQKWANSSSNQWPLPGEIVDFSANWILLTPMKGVQSLWLDHVAILHCQSFHLRHRSPIFSQKWASRCSIHCPFFRSKSWFFNPYWNGISLISGWITLFRLCGESQLPGLSFEA